MGGNVFLENVSPRLFGAHRNPASAHPIWGELARALPFRQGGQSAVSDGHISASPRRGSRRARRRDFRRRRISMFLHPIHTDDKGLGRLVFVIAPATFLLCWPYNAYRMGKFRKKQRMPPRAVSRRAARRMICMICCSLLGGLAPAVLLL